MTLPIAVCTLAVIALLDAERRGSRRGVWVAKPIAAAAFVGAGAVSGAFSGGDWLLGAALLLCAAGDVLLIPRERNACFLAGIAAFALGHIAYAAAFVSRGIDGTSALAAAGAMGVVAFFTLRGLAPHLPPDFRGPVHAYIAIIGGMVACAIGASSAGAPPAVALGAVAFAASDLSVARDRFVAPAFANVVWGLPLYFGAQLVLASTASAG